MLRDLKLNIRYWTSEVVNHKNSSSTTMDLCIAALHHSRIPIISNFRFTAVIMVYSSCNASKIENVFFFFLWNICFKKLNPLLKSAHICSAISSTQKCLFYSNLKPPASTDWGRLRLPTFIEQRPIIRANNLFSFLFYNDNNINK